MRPRLLDLFCGAGGAAMGYHRAGFDVVGVDNRPQPHYPFEFIQADALEWFAAVLDERELICFTSAAGNAQVDSAALRPQPSVAGHEAAAVAADSPRLGPALQDPVVVAEGVVPGARDEFAVDGAEERHRSQVKTAVGWFDAVHASPPCQAYSVLKHLSNRTHSDLVAATRAVLIRSGLPYVIENVPGAPLLNPVTICGSALGMDIRRHRLFESNRSLMVPPCVHGWQTPRFETQLSTSRAKERRRKGLATVVSVAGHESNFYKSSVVSVYGEPGGKGGVDLWRQVMGIDWMTRAELAQSIPPLYTELIGHQLMQQIRWAA